MQMRCESYAGWCCFMGLVCQFWSFECNYKCTNPTTYQSVTMLFAESLLYKEGECSAGLWHRESDLAEDRWEVSGGSLCLCCVFVDCLINEKHLHVFVRGRVIPADLEAKVIDAKQKVSLQCTRINSSTLTKLLQHYMRLLCLNCIFV